MAQAGCDGPGGVRGEGGAEETGGGAGTGHAGRGAVTRGVPWTRGGAAPSLPRNRAPGSGRRGSFLGSRRAPHLHQKEPQDRPLQDAKQHNTQRLSVRGCVTG